MDLFAGLCGWSEPFAARGHEVFSIDFDEKFDVSLHADIEKVTPSDIPWKPDIILASPPCEAFSVMTIGRNWTVQHQPKTEKAKLAIRLVEATRRLITELEPAYYVIENPRGKLRKLPPVADLERRTITYCQYGEPYMKPTDLWGGFPPSLVLKPTCKPKSPCHASAARGSRTGIQGNMEARWTHPVLLAQSNNGHRADERERTKAGLEYLGASKLQCPDCQKRFAVTSDTCPSCGWVIPDDILKLIEDGVLVSLKGIPYSQFGLVGQVQAKYWSSDPRRAEASALRAKIPEPLAMDVCLAAETDFAAGAAASQGLWQPTFWSNL